MKHIRKPTMPVTPWDMPRDDPVDIYPKDQAQFVRKTGEKPVHIPRAIPKPVDTLESRTLNGWLNISDLKYMGLALLQMRDEVFELRERVRLLEAANAGLQSGGKDG